MELKLQIRILVFVCFSPLLSLCPLSQNAPSSATSQLRYSMPCYSSWASTYWQLVESPEVDPCSGPKTGRLCPYMVVSQNRGVPSIDPKTPSPYYKDPRKGTHYWFWKTPISSFMISHTHSHLPFPATHTKHHEAKYVFGSPWQACKSKAYAVRLSLLQGLEFMFLWKVSPS